ncbi:MAG TPA: sporulation protein [Bacillota bacterium]|nr:sporulation protein [Bacillota bacterium]
MSHALKYLYESISNYVDEDPISASIYKKMEEQEYIHEEAFIEDLEEEEIAHLDTLLAKEMMYARRAEDDVREKELHAIYEVLF